LVVASDEQYESIPNDKIVLLPRKFYALHKFHKERRRSPSGVTPVKGIHRDRKRNTDAAHGAVHLTAAALPWIGMRPSHQQHLP
jgi:hypothetical protein